MGRYQGTMPWDSSDMGMVPKTGNGAVISSIFVEMGLVRGLTTFMQKIHIDEGVA